MVFLLVLVQYIKNILLNLGLFKMLFWNSFSMNRARVYFFFIETWLLNNYLRQNYLYYGRYQFGNIDIFIVMAGSYLDFIPILHSTTGKI